MRLRFKVGFTAIFLILVYSGIRHIYNAGFFKRTYVIKANNFSGFSWQPTPELPKPTTGVPLVASSTTPPPISSITGPPTPPPTSRPTAPPTAPTAAFPGPDELIMIVVFGNITSEKLSTIRETVGSIHYLDTQAIAQGRQSSYHHVLVVTERGKNWVEEEVRLWRGAEHAFFHELMTSISLFTNPNEPGPPLVRETDQAVALFLLFDLVTLSKGTLVNVQSGYQFQTEAGLARVFDDVRFKGHLTGEGGVMQAYTREGFLEQHEERLRCFRGLCKDKSKQFEMLNWSPPQSEPLQQYGIAKPKDGDKFCHLALRPEAMFTSALPGVHQSHWSPKTDQNKFNGPNPRICFGLPVKSPNVKFEDSPLVAVFIPSFLKSLTAEESTKFTFALYLGYDHGDKMLDTDQQGFDQALHASFKGLSVAVKYHVVPNSRWLTYIWNSLFVDAMHDGCEYYYQTNDDIEFQSTGWASAFVKSLASNNNIGVVAPNDHTAPAERARNCGLFTQSMVHRTHYDIFTWFYPLEIRDWYSDDWMTQVYKQPESVCHPQHTISNGKAGTRYNNCGNPPWEQAVWKGQTTIQQWKQQGKPKRRL